jgi:hypothetical protein
MSTFTKQFVNADEYEEWLLQVGHRINVLSITNPAGAQRVYKARPQWLNGASNPTEVTASSDQQPGAEITVKYRTSDPSLAPAKTTTTVVAQVSIVAAVFFAVFVYAILKF